LQLRKPVAQLAQRFDDADAIGGLEFFLGLFAHLRRVKAEPDRLDVRIIRPRLDELFDVALAQRLLARHRAMHRDLVAFDVLEDAIVGRRRPAHVVFGLQTIDRDADLQPGNLRPLDRNRTHGARHDLDEQSALGQLGQQHIQLAIAHQRLAADERDVQRLHPVDDFEDAFD